IEFLEFCNVLENIANTTKRLEIQKCLGNFLKSVIRRDKESLIPILFLSSATVYPQFTNIELGIGDFTIQNTVCEATGLSIKSVRSALIKSGDLGTIAMERRVAQLIIVKIHLTCWDVFEKLKAIARSTGRSSTNLKRNIMLSLINVASPLETKYLIRLFETKLKIGLALQTILISISEAFDCMDCQIVKSAYNKNPDFSNLIKLIFKFGIENLEQYSKIMPGIPLKPMLATPTNNLTKAFSKFEGSKFISEYKYDGERVQIHSSGKISTAEDMDGLKNIEVGSINSEFTNTKIFSRNIEDISIKFPDIVELKLSEKSFILDGEAVAFSDGKIQPFQLLSTRKRKNIDKIEVQGVIGFDTSGTKGRFQFAKYEICKSLDDIDSIFKSSIESCCEGLMLKSLECLYKPSHRSNSWVKLKKDYLDNLGDTIDLVVIGAFYGKGKRTGMYGGFLLAVFNDETEKYEAICKIGTGFSDENLMNFYNKLVTAIDNSEIESTITPDVWVKPVIVWEVKAASLSLSPLYSAGMIDGKGISLRFPRFIREREDKGPKDATSSSQIVRMYADEVNGVDEDDEFN
ncbi:unnamed protein product, partial [Medioppia subpectinata]